jgi:hypothetical protein
MMYYKKLKKLKYFDVDFFDKLNGKIYEKGSSLFQNPSISFI